MERREFLASGAGMALMPARARADVASDGALYALLDRLFYERQALSPERASATGFDKGPRAALKSQLDDRSRAGVDRWAAWNGAALRAVNGVSAGALSPVARRQRETVLWGLQRAVKSARFGLASVQQPYVLSQANGAYFAVPDFLDSRHTIVNTADAQGFMARLEAFGGAIDQDSARQAELAPRGIIAPVWALELTLRQLRAARKAGADDHPITLSIDRRTAAKGITGNWAAQASAILAAKVYPALDRQIAYVESLKAQSPAGDGIWRVKDGEAIYAAALGEATTTGFAPDEVHRIGLAQVAELTARLDSVLRAGGMTQGWVGERLAALNTRPEQLFANDDDGRGALLASLNAGVAAMQTRLGQAFNDVPHDPLEIRRVPEEIQDGAPNGYYYRAPLDGSRPAIYWINLRDTGDWPRYGLPDLTYHEGLPGHHLQLSYVRHAGNLPLILRDSSNSAYTEGWALYAEELASDLGAFSGLEQAGYLQSLLFRASRLVVDTGIHSKRWSREQAVDYMMATTGFPKGRCQSEVERYICMIGQACSYKIGHNVWHGARERARAALGAKFTLGWFHEILQEGAMPLAMLDRRVDERIAERLKG